MNRICALLRGINVGGKNKLPMADLRDLAAQIGLSDPRTYIQSGNLIAGSDRPPAKVAAALKDGIARRFGYDVPVVVRTIAELEAARDATPFPPDDIDHRSLHVLFLDRAPDPAAAPDPDRSPGDRFQAVGRHLYVRYANGAGRSKLTLPWLERQYGVTATARNWRTLLKLIDLLG